MMFMIRSTLAYDFEQFLFRPLLRNASRLNGDARFGSAELWNVAD